MKTAAKPRTTTSKSRVAAHRKKLRAQGLRPIQIWVPDTRSPEFRTELRKQLRRIARSKQEKDDQAFMDSHFEEMMQDIAREER